MSTELDARGALGRAIRGARQFDRSRVSLRAGVVAAIPVAATLALGTVIDQPVAAVTMGAGAMLGGVAWRAAGPDNPPLGTMAAAIIGLGIATVTGSADGRYPWLHLALLIVLCLSAGLLVSFGRRGSVPGTQMIIAYVVFGRFSQPFAQALGLAGLVMAGAGAQAAFASLVALPPAWRLQRDAVAGAYRQLAVVASGSDRTTAEAAAALDDAESRLTAPTLLGDPALMTLSSLVEEGRRIRLALIALRVEGGAEDIGGLAAGVLQRVADAVADPREDHDAALERAIASLYEAWPANAARQPEALAGQLHAIARLAQEAQHGRPWTAARPSRGSRRPLDRMRSDLGQLRANISRHSAAGRHALRLAVVVAIAELLAQDANLPRGYWVVVAAATVLRPEFGATFTRGAERMVGTVSGVVIATLIVVAIDPRGWGIVAVVGLLACATYAVFPASFAAGIAGLTGMVVFLLHAVAPDSATIALDRGIDTVIGGALGLGAYALWPTWSGRSTGQVMGDLVDAQREYLVAVLGCVVDGTPASEERMRPLARRARIAWTNAEALITLAQSEPARRLGDTGMRSIAALGGLRRLVYAAHTLRSELTDVGEGRSPRPSWAAFRDGLAEALTVIGAAVRHGSAGELPELRALYRDARAGGPLEQTLLGPLDEVVDATNTVAASLGLGVGSAGLGVGVGSRAGSGPGAAAPASSLNVED